MQQLAPAARPVTSHASHGVTLRPVARTEDAHVALLEFAPGALLGRHPAVLPQTLAVVSGTGWASGGDGRRLELAAGDIVRFDPGEEHESGSHDGMTALVVETVTPAG